VVTALLVTSAATLFESAPFILAAVVFVRVPLRWNSWMVPYLGCGCGAGPSARSLPAAAATCWVFGPFVAGARLAAAVVAARLFRHARPCDERDAALLTQLSALLPLAGIGATVAFFGPTLFGTHASALAAFAGGAAAAFVMAPCGVGTVGLAAAVRGSLPAAAGGLLCIAGIVDLRTWLRMPHHDDHHDTLAYAISAVACALVAARGGAGLVHPRIAISLWACAIACTVLAYRHRTDRSARLRLAPVVMLLGAVLAAPPPEYHATETTLIDAFAGERIDFTGIATHTGGATTLVRYAITCCRADASPVAVRLAGASRSLHGWVHARGTLVQSSGGLRLRPDELRAIPPPADPFVYR
jgi:hypothetical protein